FVWNGLTFTTSGSQTAHFTNAAGCDSAATLNLTVSPSILVSSSASQVCLGFTISLTPNSGGTWVSNNPTVASVTNSGVVTGLSSGLVTFTFTSSTTNCTATTSAVTVNVLPFVSGTKVCVGSTTTLSPTSGGTWVSNNTAVATVTNSGVVTGISSGSTTFTFTDAITGCSKTTASIDIVATSVSITNTSICSSSLPFVWNGLTFTTSGSQTAHFINAAGCDSSATLNLNVNASGVSITNTAICSSFLPYGWNGLMFITAGTQTANLINAAGCDSLATLVLTVKSISTSTTTQYICNTALPYTWNGKVYIGSTTDTVKLVNSVGCDSLAIIRLVVQTPNCNLQASYTINQIAQCVTGNSFSFTSNVTGNTGVLTYLWNFGDGTTSTAANPTHTYATAGEYDVTLVVTEANACIGSCTAYASAKQVYIGPKPVVNFDWQYNGSCLTYDFNSNSTVSMGWIIDRFWDFGNGQTSIQNNPLATFAAPGIYNVKLVVTTNYGCKDSIIFPVNIINKCTNPGAGGTTGSTGGGG
ncbi:MAG: PKD domain-containing protein, partial [Dolichospermum sp.]